MVIHAMRILPGISGCMMIALVLLFSSCTSELLDKEHPGNPELEAVFPDFITPNTEYYDTRIAEVPAINGENYELKISGAVDHPGSFSLEELRSLDMVKRTLTIECIGNTSNGKLLGTAEWRGFRVYDLLKELGLKEGATTVKYMSADGYFTYNSLDELQDREVLGALYMNDEPIPPLYGYPLRVIFPGYFGVRQPGWIVEMNGADPGGKLTPPWPLTARFSFL
jgi:DMSO/TMAO reductase YedYZ molybdopterin-dependent catalytic subunit